MVRLASGTTLNYISFTLSWNHLQFISNIRFGLFMCETSGVKYGEGIVGTVLLTQ